MSIGGDGGSLVKLSVVTQEAKAVGPRSRNPEAVVRAVLDQAMSDLKFAVGCIYAIPRGGKVVRGASVRLAEILRYVWGGIWIEAVDVTEHDEFVVAKVVGVDMVNGNLTCEIVPERVVDRHGRRYDLDGIINAKRAALAKAKRNVILDLIPASLVSNRVVVALRAKLAAKRQQIEQEYTESLAELGTRFGRPVEVLRQELSRRLGVAVYDDEANKVISSDFMLTVIEYANAIEDLVAGSEPGGPSVGERKEDQFASGKGDGTDSTVAGTEHTVGKETTSEVEVEPGLIAGERRVRAIRR